MLGAKAELRLSSQEVSGSYREGALGLQETKHGKLKQILSSQLLSGAQG